MMLFSGFLPAFLASVLSLAAIASAETNFNDATALGDLKQALLSLGNYPAVSTWSGDPCGDDSNCCFFNASSSNGLPSCHWAHICCSSFHVTYVDAGCIYQNCSLSNNITVPSSLRFMPMLTFLNLSANGFTGPLPSDWSSLTSLSILNLRSNKYTGTVPPSWSNLQSLTQLDLSLNCGLCGLVNQTITNYAGTALQHQCGTYSACSAATLSSAFIMALAIGGGIVGGFIVLVPLTWFLMMRCQYGPAYVQETVVPDWRPSDYYLSYAQRRLQGILMSQNDFGEGPLPRPPTPPVFIPLFEVSLGKKYDRLSFRDSRREPTMIPVGTNEYAILVEDPGDTCLCLAHPDADEEPPAAESKKAKKMKKNENEEGKRPVGDVEMGTLRSNPQAPSSQHGVRSSNSPSVPTRWFAHPVAPEPENDTSRSRGSPS